MHVPGQRTCVDARFASFWRALALAGCRNRVRADAQERLRARRRAVRRRFPSCASPCGRAIAPGWSASKDDGLIFPRTIVQVPDTRFFVVADMGGWDPKQGPRAAARSAGRRGQAPQGAAARARPAARARGRHRPAHLCRRGGQDLPLRSARRPIRPRRVETIMQGLPGLQPVLADGTKLKRNSHPLKHFVFDRTGRIFVNIGAPSDACATSANETKPCAAGEGAVAARRRVDVHAAGRRHLPGAAAGRGESEARGVRARPAQLDGARRASALSRRGLCAAAGRERARHPRRRRSRTRRSTCWSRASTTAGRIATTSRRSAPNMRRSSRPVRPYRNLCANAALYRRPHSVMPPHGAPLGMLYYHGEKFAELKDKLIVALHGYRPTGSRVLVYDTDARGLPTVERAAGALQCELRGERGVCRERQADRRPRPTSS